MYNTNERQVVNNKDDKLCTAQTTSYQQVNNTHKKLPTIYITKTNNIDNANSNNQFKTPLPQSATEKLRLH